jgi:hypothetical protein
VVQQISIKLPDDVFQQVQMTRAARMQLNPQDKAPTQTDIIVETLRIGFGKKQEGAYS